MKTFQHSGQYGDLKKFEVMINDKDVTEAILSCHIFQEIFAPTNTSNLVINDTNNLMMNVPIRAGSKISIKYETEHGSENDGEKTWEMLIYKVGEKDAPNSKHQTYTVFAAHESFFKNQTKKIQKSFKNKTAVKIAQDIVEEFLGGEIETEDSDGNMSLIISNWTPFYAVNWLSKIATKNNAADYVFFQNHEDKWIMKPFEKIYAEDSESSGIKLRVRPTAIRNDSGDIDDDYTTIVGKYQFEHYDAISNVSSGYYKSKLLTYDFIGKKFDSKVFTFGDDCPDDKTKLKTDDEFLMAAEDTNISFLPMHPKMFDSGPAFTDTSAKWHGSRKSSLNKFEQEKLIVQLPGSAKSCEWFGKNIEFDLPSQDSMSGEDYDTTRRGKYLVMSIGHMITGGTYKVNLELVKKRLEE